MFDSQHRCTLANQQTSVCYTSYPFLIDRDSTLGGPAAESHAVLSVANASFVEELCPECLGVSSSYDGALACLEPLHAGVAGV